MIVVDASALLEVLLRTPAADSVEDRLFAPDQTLHAPHLLDVEVAQVVRRYAETGEIDSERGRLALEDLADFPLQRFRHDFLLPRIWSLRNNLTACDAAHGALAEALDAPLLTRDRRLAAPPVMMRRSSWCSLPGASLPLTPALSPQAGRGRSSPGQPVNSRSSAACRACRTDFCGIVQSPV